MNRSTSFTNVLSVRNRFFKYVVPSVGSMWLFSIYTMIDGMFVGLGIGPSALAAVNLAMPFVSTIFALALLVAVSASTLISFALGKDRQREAHEWFTWHLCITGGLGLLISIIALFNLPALARLLGATPDTLPMVMDYLRVIILFTPFFMLGYSLEVMVRADGYPQYAIRCMVLATATNIVLDYLLVIQFSYGVQGAAIATGMSHLTAFSFFTHHFWKGNTQLRLVRLRWSKAVLKLFTVGIPEALTEFSLGFVVFAFNPVFPDCVTIKATTFANTQTPIVTKERFITS